MSEFLMMAQQAAAVVGDGKVEVPWGDWAGTAAVWFGVGVAGVGAWVVRFLPPYLRWTAQVAGVDQLLDKAIQFGLNKVPGALKGKVLTVEISNRVVEFAAEYAIAHAPKLVQNFIGPLTLLREKILARLEVE